MEEYSWEERISQAAAALEEWFKNNKRDLPWRKNVTAYRVWISEIMLQQTRVEAVKPYYQRFLQRLPDVAALAAVPDDELMKLWEGLGYYSRARNLKKAAAACTEQYAGELPSTYEKLLKLPGIGSYTAGAIPSIAYGEPKPAVDGNVLRVVNRILGDESDITKPETKKNMELCLERIHREYLEYAPGDFNQALMELGACVCIPNGEPLCESCPVQTYCKAYADHITDRIPYKPPKQPRKKQQRTVFVLADDTCMAVAKRPEKGLLAGMYELPAVEETWTEEQVCQYWKSLLGTAPAVQPLPAGKHIFTHIEWHMTAWQIILPEPVSVYEKQLAAAGLQILTKQQLKTQYALPSAFKTWSFCWQEL